METITANITPTPICDTPLSPQITAPAFIDNTASPAFHPLKDIITQAVITPVLSAIRQNEFWSLIRTSPVTFLMCLTLISMLYPTIDNYFFILFYVACFISNNVFKMGFKLIYWVLGTDYIPGIGQGTRPEGAHTCSSFIQVPLAPASTFGMPSGHSQLAWFFAIYGCLHIINCEFDYFQGFMTQWNPYLQGLCCFGLVLFASVISYSRVAIEECHTTGQVIWGAIIGIVFAGIAYRLKQWIKTKLRL